MWRVGTLGALVGAVILFHGFAARAQGAPPAPAQAPSGQSAPAGTATGQSASAGTATGQSAPAGAPGGQAPPAQAPSGATGRADLAGLLRAGAAAAKVGQWQACIQAYSAAAAIDDAPATAGDLGLCEERAGRFADAHRHLRRALDAGPTRPKGDPWQRYQAAFARVAERVAVLFVTVTPPAAAVLLDGRPIGRADGRGIAVEPGTHTVAARLAGHEDAVETRTMSARDVPHVHLVLRKKPTGTPPPGQPHTTPDSQPGAASSRLPRALPAAERPLSVGSGGPVRSSFPCLPDASAPGVLVPLACLGGAVFVGSVAVAIGSEVHATSLREDLVARGFRRDACAPGQPAAGSAECEDILSRQQLRDASLDVMIGFGAAALVLGGAAAAAVLLDRPRPRVTVTAGPGGGGLAILGTW